MSRVGWANSAELQTTLGTPFLISLKIEYALAILPFFEYTKSKKLILEAMSNFGLEISFTGKLGVRTKYQQFQVPQLIVEVSQATADSEQPAESSLPSQTAPHIAKLDDIEDNILYETPVLTSLLETKEAPGQDSQIDQSGYYSFIDVEGVRKISKTSNNDSSTQPKVSLTANICILALIKHMIFSRPLDDMLREQVTAYIEKCLEEYSSWAVLLNQLMIRSDLEFRQNKKLDRAMIQYEAIMEDSNSKKGSPMDRLRFLHVIHYPPFLEVSSKFARNYMKMNSYMSASIVFEEVGRPPNNRSSSGNKPSSVK